MNPTVTLRGITWNHSRGYSPMAATAQRFHELHPDVEVVWQKRSLQAFADAPVEKLAQDFDLLVIDHPCIGHAVHLGSFLPLDDDSSFLNGQREEAVGRSHESYRWDGFSWAFAIDAATPVSSWRPDLLERERLTVPQSWEEVLELAGRGWVTLPAIPIDGLMHFYMLCLAVGDGLFGSAAEMVSPDAGERALLHLQELVRRCGAACLERNPIAVYEVMTRTDDVAYCPFAYGYSNYARVGYGRRTLRFGDLPAFGTAGPLRSTLGGTGLAVSAHSPHREKALAYARFVADPECQRTLFMQSGGQPGHRSAWTDEETNRLTGDFFRDTLPALDRAYLRPRHRGYLEFQDRAGELVHHFLVTGGDPAKTVRALNAAYARASGAVA